MPDRAYLTSHLAELRRRLIRVAFVFILLFIVCFIFSEAFVTQIASKFGTITIAALSPVDYILARLKLALWLSALATLLPFLIELYSFVKPGLKPNELKWLRAGLLPGILLFYIGVGFGATLIAPFTLTALARWTPTSVQNIWSISKLIRLFATIGFGTGLLFEFPLAALILNRMGLLPRALLAGRRRHVYVLIFLVAALLTPPDALSQILLAVPLVFIYELTLLVVPRETPKPGR